MKITYSILTGILFWGLGLLLYILVANLISNISDYFAKKRDSVIKSDFFIEHHNERLTLEARLNISNELLKMIDDMIMTEFGGVLHRFAVMSEIYPVLSFDDDVKNVATNVFNSFKPNTFSSPELCITEDFLLKYITERSKTLALSSVFEYNTALQGKQNLIDSIMENDEE